MAVEIWSEFALDCQDMILFWLFNLNEIGPFYDKRSKRERFYAADGETNKLLTIL